MSFITTLINIEPQTADGKLKLAILAIVAAILIYNAGEAAGEAYYHLTH